MTTLIVSTVLSTVLIAAAASAQVGLQPQVQPAQPRSRTRVSHVTITELATQRVLTHENGQVLTVERHDLCQFSVALVRVSREQAVYVYTYKVSNTGSQPIHQLWFYTPLALVWYDAAGIAPESSREVTFRSEYPPQQTVLRARYRDAEKRLEELTRNPVPEDTNPELFSEMVRVCSGEFDSAKMVVLGPHKPLTQTVTEQ